jgi:hypothetical protein
MVKVREVNVNPDDKHAVDLAAHTIKVWCCREWEVSPVFNWGRCKICGEKPRA